MTESNRCSIYCLFENFRRLMIRFLAKFDLKFFFQIFHDSIRKKIDRCDTNNNNRRVVKKIVRQIEFIEKIFKFHRNKNFKNNSAKKRKHRKNFEKFSTKSNVVNFLGANKDKKK